MQTQGAILPGDVILSTHVCPNAPARPHEPVDFMDSPVETEERNAHEVVPAMDAVLSIDTTKGNRINGVYHINSILQPSIATTAPVVGVALRTESVVPGCGTGTSHEIDIALAVKFAVEVAKEFTRGTCSFYDAAEYDRLIELYGCLAHLQRRAVAAGE